MNSMQDKKNELKQFGFPQQILSRLYRLIDKNNYKHHVVARENFVKENKKILPVMHKLIKSDYKIIRKEAIKIIELIAHKSSIPEAINMLEDMESEIRWIAAETLIRIGRDSIKPLLDALVANGVSYYLRQGAHHVLSELVNEDDPDELKQLVHDIKYSIKNSEVIPNKAAHVLDKNTF